MAESNIPVTSGSGNAVDVFSLPNSNLRQAVVLGDSAIAGNVAPVQATDPSSSAFGLVVRDVNSSAIVAKLTSGVTVSPSGTFAVFFDQSSPTVKAVPSSGSTFNFQLDPGHEIGSVKGINTSVAVFFDRGNPSVLSNAGTGTFNVQFDPGHTLGNIASVGSITNTVAVFFSPANPTVNATFSASGTLAVDNVTASGGQTMDENYKAQRVLFVGSSTNSSLVISSITNTVAVFFSPANPSVSATFSAASIEVIPTTGSRKITDDASASMRVLFAGSQTNASLTINGTVTSNAGTGTMTVKFDPGNTLGKVDQGVGGTSAWLANIQGTASIFTASGSASGVSVSGNTIISPSANASFKIYAYSIQTTGQVSMTTKFTNGSGGSPTEFFRPLITASGVTGAQGANLASAPGQPLFVTGVSTTLSLVLDTASLVHYSVSYTKESA